MGGGLILDISRLAYLLQIAVDEEPHIMASDRGAVVVAGKWWPYSREFCAKILR